VDGSETVSGTLYGVGVGPGDPELLTLKAARIIQHCPVIAYPTLDGTASFARSIVATYLTNKTEIPISIPMGNATATQQAYDDARSKITDQLVAGRDVAVLCEGDPFFYGSFMYMYARLFEHHPVMVIPGVSSPMAAAAALSMPLAAHNDVFTVLPAPLDDAVLTARLTTTDSAAIIKLGRHFPRIHTLLRRLDLIDRSRYIERATLPAQKLLPLDHVHGDRVPYFSMILVHRRRLAWQDG
jgi:precorrin-2/cobalt-factor-2 C20-methyltransferase